MRRSIGKILNRISIVAICIMMNVMCSGCNNGVNQIETTSQTVTINNEQSSGEQTGNETVGQDASNNENNTVEEKNTEIITQNETESTIPEEEKMVLTESYKKLQNNNPLVTQKYSADPGIMIYDGTVYVYSTNDAYEYKDGKVIENTYSKIQTINCFSSSDLVNWTDHGSMQISGQTGAATWASCAWAPCAAHKTIDGKEKFFLYFANNGSGVGVVCSDTPYGPWEDPIGGPLVTQRTENCSGAVWCFDPAIFVDEDGAAYLYFGGGIPQGGEANPQSTRVVKLGDDMVSLAGVPQAIDAPYLFEDSGINRIGDKYYYSYCSNWSTQGTEYSTCAIEYMVGDSPMGPFTYCGEMFKNPGVTFGVWGNNHHTLFEFEGKYYLAYHNRRLETIALKENLGYRCTFIDEVTVNGDEINLPKPTMAGVTQVKNLNPFTTVKASTMAIQAGINVYGVGDCYVSDIETGDWMGLKGVDFSEGAGEITFSVKSDDKAMIEIYLNTPDGEKVGEVAFEATNGEYAEVTASLSDVAGVKDVFFVFTGSFEFDSWVAK